MPPSFLPSGPSFLPVPSALVSFCSVGGLHRVLPVGWLGVVCDVPPLLTVSFHPGAAGRRLLRLGDPFVVNLPTEEMTQTLAARRCPNQEGNRPASDQSPLQYISAESKKVPLVAGCPVRIECRCRALTVRFGQYRLCGEVLAVHLDGLRQEVVAPVDLGRLSLFLRSRFQGHGAGLETRTVSVSVS
jgi:flavin reductase (DIM6/NTAB) family NADH-FMN oxidoreductase RutF